MDEQEPHIEELGPVVPPGRPRMPFANSGGLRRAFFGALAIGLVQLFFALSNKVTPWWAFVGAGLFVGGCTLALSLGQLVKQIWTVRTVVRRLRSLTPARLKHALDVFEDARVRDYLVQLIATHGTMDEPGPMERFAFSPVDRRENTLFSWIAGGTAALGIVAAIGLPASAPGWRVISIALAIVSLMFVVLLDRRGRELQRIFEVSAFGLTEVLPTGAVRRLQWHGPIRLRNRKWRRRIEIGPAAGSDAIVIPYAIIGFDRAVELILEHGGLEPAD